MKFKELLNEITKMSTIIGRVEFNIKIKEIGNNKTSDDSFIVIGADIDKKELQAINRDKNLKFNEKELKNIASIIINHLKSFGIETPMKMISYKNDIAQGIILIIPKNKKVFTDNDIKIIKDKLPNILKNIKINLNVKYKTINTDITSVPIAGIDYLIKNKKVI